MQVFIDNVCVDVEVDGCVKDLLKDSTVKHGAIVLDGVMMDPEALISETSIVAGARMSVVKNNLLVVKDICKTIDSLQRTDNFDDGMWISTAKQSEDPPMMFALLTIKNLVGVRTTLRIQDVILKHRELFLSVFNNISDIESVTLEEHITVGTTFVVYCEKHDIDLTDLVVVFAAVYKGLNPGFYSDAIKDDAEMLHVLRRGNSEAYRFCSERLSKDKDFIRHIVRVDEDNMQLMHMSLFRDTDFIIQLIEADTFNIDEIFDRCGEDENIERIKTALSESPRIEERIETVMLRNVIRNLVERIN